MSDSVELLIGGSRINGFKSYSVESDIFKGADAFTLELRDTGMDLSKEVRCQLRVNRETELMGIIDSVERNVISGRDLMGLVADAYVEEFISLDNMSLKALAEKLLAKVPFINRKKIIYGKGSKLRALDTAPGDDTYEFTQLKPGDMVFDVLRDHALREGRVFFSMPDGTFVFGSPKTSGEAEFHIVRRLSGRGNNVKDGWKTVNRAAEYSEIRVLGQEGGEAWDTGGGNTLATVRNPGFPYHKPYVAVAEMDGGDPKKYAGILLSKQMFQGFGLTYIVPGHSQGGRNWQVNSIVNVLDEHPQVDIRGDYLAYSRTFRRSDGESAGTETELKLSPLGALPA